MAIIFEKAANLWPSVSLSFHHSLRFSNNLFLSLYISWIIPIKMKYKGQRMLWEKELSWPSVWVIHGLLNVFGCCQGWSSPAQPRIASKRSPKWSSEVRRKIRLEKQSFTSSIFELSLLLWNLKFLGFVWGRRQRPREKF